MNLRQQQDKGLRGKKPGTDATAKIAAAFYWCSTLAAVGWALWGREAVSEPAEPRR